MTTLEKQAVLVVERDAAVRDPLVAAVASAGFAASGTPGLDEAAKALAAEPAAVALVPASGGAPVGDAVKRLRQARPDIEVVVHARGASARMVRDALRAGAIDFYDAAAEGADALAAVLRRACERRAAEAQKRTLLSEARPLVEDLLRTVVRAERHSLDLEAAARGEPPDGAYRALVIDHEPAPRRLLAGLLVAEGLEVHQAGDATAGLAALAPGAFQLVVVERRLPGADGLALVREARARIPGVEAALIVPAGAAETAASLADLGVSTVVTKPIAEADVAARLREVVSRHKRLIKAQRYLEAIRGRNGEFLDRLEAFRERLEKAGG